MKKALFFLLTLLVASSVMAQTYEQNQNLIDTQAAKLEKRLGEVKGRIFYLEVTLNNRIIKAKGLEAEKLLKEKHFAKEDGANLMIEKAKLEKALSSLRETALVGMEYRTQSDQKSNIPLEMSATKFNRRTRSQSYKALEQSFNGVADDSQKLEGLLINYKVGRDEVVSFLIYRTDIKSIPIGPFLLNPRERLTVKLLPGTYNVAVSDGYQVETIKDIPVDPRIEKHADGRKVYWFAYGM